MTPRQTQQSAFTVTYGGTTPYRAVLDYWQSGALDKPLLVITGFDPLNEDTTANYLMLMGDVVRTLNAEGYRRHHRQARRRQPAARLVPGRGGRVGG